MGPQDGVDIVIRAADVIVHELDRNDIAFTLMGAGDCYDDLVALRDDARAGRPRRVHRAVRRTTWCARSCRPPIVGLSPDPKNPLNDVSTMNKTMEYMAFELPVVAFDLRGDQSLGAARPPRTSNQATRRLRPGDRRASGRRREREP